MAKIYVNSNVESLVIEKEPSCPNKAGIYKSGATSPDVDIIRFRETYTIVGCDPIVSINGAVQFTPKGRTGQSTFHLSVPIPVIGDPDGIVEGPITVTDNIVNNVKVGFSKSSPPKLDLEITTITPVTGNTKLAYYISYYTT